VSTGVNGRQTSEINVFEPEAGNRAANTWPNARLRYALDEPARLRRAVEGIRVFSTFSTMRAAVQRPCVQSARLMLNRGVTESKRAPNTLID
jgi:hypothetical protein